MPIKKSTAPVMDAATFVAAMAGLIEVAGNDLIRLPSKMDPKQPTRFVPLVDEEVRVRLATTVDGHTELAEFRIKFAINRDPVTNGERAIVDEAERNSKVKSQEKKAQEEQNKKALINGVKAETKAETREAFEHAANVVRQLTEAQAAARALGLNVSPIGHGA